MPKDEKTAGKEIGAGKPPGAPGRRTIVWRAGLLGCGGLILLALVFALFLFFNFANFVRGGLNYSISKIEQRLLRVSTTVPEESFELRDYLEALRWYLARNPINRATLSRYRIVVNAIQAAMNDNMVTVDEMSRIRTQVRSARLPLPQRYYSVPAPSKPNAAGGVSASAAKARKTPPPKAGVKKKGK